MEFTGPITATTATAPARSEAGVSAWQVGQILKAVTVSPLPGGQTQLQIGNQLVQGQSPIPLQAGQALEVQVQALQPQVVLRLLPGSSLVTSAELKTDAVRTLLPKQDSMAPLLRNLGTLVASRQAPLPPLLHALSSHMIRQLPEPATVSSAAGLRQAVEHSGLFLESRLLQSSPGARVDFNTDLKANLLRLVQLLRNWPGISQQARGAARTPGSAPPAAAAPQGNLAATPTGGTTPGASTLPGGTATATNPQGGTAIPTATQGRVTAGGQGNAATLARGVGPNLTLPSTPPLPATATLTTPTPPPPTGTPAPLFPIPPPPPLRGQAPVPMDRGQASLQALLPASLLRPELQKQAEAAVARVQLAQLASLPQERASGMEWLLDLPIRRGDDTDMWSLQIRYGQEETGRNSEEAAPAWNVYLAFDLPGLGPMQARVSLRGEDISTWFWATQASTVPYLESHLRELRQHLEDAGLKVVELHCRQGSMPVAKSPQENAAPLLDERT